MMEPQYVFMEPQEVFAAIIIIMLSLVLIFAGVHIRTLKEQAAQTSCAQYNPETGKFEWLEEGE